MKSRLWKLVPLLIIVVFVIFVRVRLADFPLERDEGEYGYFGQLILQGVPPYALAYNMKFPGTYFIYAVIMAIFGQTAQGIHFGVLLTNIASIVLLFLIGRKLVNYMVGIIAGATYAALSLSYSVLGSAGHATHFVNLFALGGFLCLLEAFSSDKKRFYLISGILFALAILMKQSGVFFAAFAASAIIFKDFVQKPGRTKESFMRLAVFSAGFLTPIFFTLSFLCMTGVYERFYFWAFTYLSHYVAQVPLRYAIEIFKNNTISAISGFYIIWLSAAMGLLAVFFNKSLKENRFLIISFLIFSFLSICPGLIFRPHYYITLLPAISLLAGIFFYTLASLIKAEHIAIGLFAVSLFLGIQSQKKYLFVKDTATLCKWIYGINPFVESPEIAKFIDSRTKPEDTVAILGSEPQIFFYSNRRSATGYIHTYSLMEYQPYSLQMQKEMIREIELKEPKIIVDVRVYFSWLVAEHSELYIFHWAEKYIPMHYNLVGVIDILSDGSIYKWGDAAKNYTPTCPNYILVYERR